MGRAASLGAAGGSGTCVAGATATLQYYYNLQVLPIVWYASYVNVLVAVVLYGAV